MMHSQPEVVEAAFWDELEKIAKVGMLRRQLHGVWGGPGLKPGEQHMLGNFKDLAMNPAGKLRSGFKDMGPGEKAMAAGFTGMEAPNVVRENKNRGKAIGSIAGSAIGWPLMRKMPFGAQMLGLGATTYLGGKAGQFAGRGLSR